jgi:hypothetical protein
MQHADFLCNLTKKKVLTFTPKSGIIIHREREIVQRENAPRGNADALYKFLSSAFLSQKNKKNEKSA